MSSIEPDDRGGEIDGGEEVASGFVVASSDGAVLFESTKEVLDQVASLVQFFVVEALILPVFLWWNDDFFSRLA